MLVASFIAALTLAVCHLVGNFLVVLGHSPRSRWISFAAGVTVAYVLLHLLPQLQRYHFALQEMNHDVLSLTEHVVYLLALVGFVLFYGLEKMARGAEPPEKQEAHSKAPVFWLHMSAYGVYNVVIGYLLVREETPRMLALFSIGIAVHFVVNDQGFRQHHGRQFRRLWRWILAGAILVGWCVAAATPPQALISGGLVALLAGGILLNTFKEELPGERESRYWSFALGSIGYAAILIAIP